METLRIIEHSATHTDIEALIFGEWVVVKCIQTKESDMYNGYVESKSMAQQRAFSRQMEAQGHKIQRSTSTLLNTEAEVDRIHDLILCAEFNDAHPVESAQAIDRKIDAQLDPRTPQQIELDEIAADWNQQVSELRG